MIKKRGLALTKEMIAQGNAEREARKAALKATLPDTTVLSNHQNTTKKQELNQGKYEKLFQDNPDEKCSYTNNKKRNFKNRSHTNSRESQQNGASKELKILQRNGRIPTKEVVLRFQKQFPTKKDFTDLLTKMFRYLGEKGIIAAVALEGTRDNLGKPCNRAHCHILIDDKDAPFGKKKLIALFEKACKLRGLERGKDVKIGCKKLPEDFTFDYFVKIGKHGKDIPLFRKGLWIRKFRYIGKWFKKKKSEIWAEYVEEMKKKYGTNNTAGAKKPTKKSLSKKK